MTSVQAQVQGELMGVAIPTELLGKDTELPKYFYPADAGAALRCTQHLVLDPGQRALVSTGIAMKIPHEYTGLIVPVPGLAIDYGVTILGTPHLVDGGHRGEVLVNLVNLGKDVFHLLPGLRIAQLVIVPIERGRFFLGET